MLINNGIMILYLMAYAFMYLFLIGQQKIRWKFLLAYSAGAFVLIVSAVQITGMPEMNFLMIPVLMSLGQFYPVKPVSLSLNLTVSLLVNASVATLHLVISTILFDLFTYVNSLPILTSMAQNNLSVVICFLLILLFRKKLYQVGSLLENTGWLVVFFLLSLVTNLISMILSSPRIEILATIFRQFQGQLLLRCLLIITGLALILLMIGLRRSDNRKILSQKEAADQEFLTYVQNLEDSYNDLAAFRHDYQNILLSLDEGIQQNDLTLVKKIYDDTIKPSKENIQSSTENSEKLHQIKLAELRSLLRVKMIQAHTQKISVILDVPLPIENITLETVTLLRLVSILLDNAIEAANSSAEKQLIVSCFYLEDNFHLLIRNSVANETINLKKMYQLGVTSKSKGQGIGLHSLKRLLAVHPNVTLITSCEDTSVTQELIIR